MAPIKTPYPGMTVNPLSSGWDLSALSALATDPTLANDRLGTFAKIAGNFIAGSEQARTKKALYDLSQAQQAALANHYKRLHSGDIKGAIGALGDYAASGASPDQLKTFNKAAESATDYKTTLDANGVPLFRSGADVLTNGGIDAAAAGKIDDRNLRDQMAQDRLSMQQQGLDLRRYLGDAILDLKKQSLDSKVPKPSKADKPLPSFVEKKLVENNSAARTIDRAFTQLSQAPNATGLLGGLVGTNPLTNKLADSKNIITRATIADIGSLKIHDRSGAAVTVSEAPRLRPFIPSTFDSPEVVKAKLRQLRQKIQEENQGYLETMVAAGHNVPDKLFDVSVTEDPNAVFTPRTVTNGKQKATVSSQAELDEALKEGFK